MTDRDLSLRLERLERENRRMKRWGGALLGGAFVLGLTSMALPTVCKTVWAERFVLKDSSGRGRLTIDGYRSGPPVITAQGAHGKTFAKLVLADEGPLLEFFDGNGECTGRMGISEEGEAYVEESEQDGVAMATR